jgi:hypothetical protein
VEGANERVGVLVAEHVVCLVELERSVQQVVLGQLPTGLFHETVERQLLRQELTLQSPGAHAQLLGHLLEPGAVAGQELLQDPLDLLLERVGLELLG